MHQRQPVTRYQRGPICCMIFAICLFALLTLAFYNRPVIRRYQVVSDKVSDRVRIVQLSDLNGAMYSDDNSDLVAMIQSQEPDIIAMTGDMANEYTPMKGMKLLLKGIKGIAPIYYVPGMREYWRGYWACVVEEVPDYNMQILINEWETGDPANVIVAGVDDVSRPCYRLGISKYDVSFLGDNDFADQFKLVLAHRPEQIKECMTYEPDLILTGHIHGGHVRIPWFFNDLLAPKNQGFPEYAGGRYDFDDTSLIVNRGLSNQDRLPRLFNPPEIVVIDIMPQEET